MNAPDHAHADIASTRDVVGLEVKLVFDHRNVNAEETPDVPAWAGVCHVGVVDPGVEFGAILRQFELVDRPGKGLIPNFPRVSCRVDPHLRSDAEVPPILDEIKPLLGVQQQIRVHLVTCERVGRTNLVHVQVECVESEFPALPETKIERGVARPNWPAEVELLLEEHVAQTGDVPTGHVEQVLLG
ncbi:MAG: hypothetical protein U0792_21065 [Gemmataceae bacterium]